MRHGFGAEAAFCASLSAFAARVAEQTIERADHVQQVEAGGRRAAFDPEQVRDTDGASAATSSFA